jgi:ATP-binding cassette subfamily C protein EexD
VAVIGPSGAGKSTLLRAALGLYPLLEGSVRLDGAELAQWEPEKLGPHIGYLPQDVELLDGTVAENIARFGEIDSEGVVAAARAAGVHDLIVRLANGYDTVVAGNRTLSAGQRQRIALARALYSDPKLVVLDEPNSNLDQEGESALAEALRALKAQRRTVILVTHRTPLLEMADQVVVLVGGQVVRRGPREAVMAALAHAAPKPVPVLRAASASGT